MVLNLHDAAGQDHIAEIFRCCFHPEPSVAWTQRFVVVLVSIVNTEQNAESLRSFHTRLCEFPVIVISSMHIHDTTSQDAGCIHATMPIGCIVIK